MSLPLETSPTVAAISKRKRVRELMRTVGMLPVLILLLIRF